MTLADNSTRRDVFWRRCRPIHVVDGDTTDFLIDLGYRLTATQRLRFLGVNTAEMHATDPALRAKAEQGKAFTAKWLADHQHGSLDTFPFDLRTEKDDAFGRYLAEVQCLAGHSLNADLLSSGNAVAFMVPKAVSPSLSA